MVLNASHQLRTLGDVAEKLIAGGDVPKNSFSKAKTDKFNVPIFGNGVTYEGLYGYTGIAKIDKPCITISARGTIGHTVVRHDRFYPIVRLIVLIPNLDEVNLVYLKHTVNSIEFRDTGSVIPQLTVPDVRNIRIPLPPLDIQQALVEVLQPLDEKISEVQAVIDGTAARKNAILKNFLYL